MLFQVTHQTVYQYAEPVSLCHNLLHLRPRPAPRQTCQRHVLVVLPEPSATQERLDYFGNPITLFAIQEPHRRLSVTAGHRIDVQPAEPVRLQETLAWERVRDLVREDRSPALLDAYQYTFASPYVPRSEALADYAAPSFAAERPLLLSVMDLMRRIHREFRYDPRATTLATAVEEVLERRQGVCQDFAHLMLGALRSLGLPARYISGYLMTRAPAGRPRLVGADASHAWVSVFCPDVGWVDFDPTNNLLPSDQHVTLAWGRDYDDVSPVKGVILGGGSHTMEVTVDVVPLGG